MQLHLKHTLLTFLLSWIVFSIGVAGQNLQPHNIIIESAIQQDQSLPTFNIHTYDLLESSTSHEPYFPPFQVSQIHFEENASLNISPSGLTKSFGGLAEVLMKEKGVLENAFLLYQSEDYVRAEEKLLSILPSTTEIGDKATLLLAWTKFKRLQFDASLSYAKAGFDAQHPTTALESFYLAYLVLSKSQSWKQIAEIHQQQYHSKEASFWDARVSLMNVMALFSLRRWEAVNYYIDNMDLRRFAHSKYFHKFYEIAAISNFKQRNYAKSLENIRNAQKLNPDLSYRKKLNRIVAWQYYFLNQYSQTINLIETSLPFSLIDESDEINYLRLASLIKLGRWQQVEKFFNQINKSSVFYKYTAFLIQTHAGKAKVDPTILKSIKGIRYDFPEMVFKSGLQEGNQLFKNNQFKDAERSYLRALSADVNGNEYHLAQYNLGLTHLKLQQYEKARRGFNELMLTLPPKSHHRLKYHLLYALYGLNRGNDYLKEINSFQLTKLSKIKIRELRFMEANVLYSMGEYSKAGKNYFQLWKQTGNINAFEAGTLVLYRQKKYKEVLTLIKKRNSPKTETISDLKIRSLLNNHQAKLALKEMSQTPFNVETKTELMLEVWMANSLYKKVISQANRLLGRSMNDHKRFLLYLSLGSAHFFLKQYTASKNQFYKALKTTSNPTQISAIQYNIALVAYYSKDYLFFIKETNMILAKKQLPDEIRYALTELLVDYYQLQKQFQKADSILASYITRYPFKKTEAKLKRIQLHYDSLSYTKCFKLAEIDDMNSSPTQYRDRLLFYGYCGIHINREADVVKRFKRELNQSKKNKYRLHELEYVLAQSYFNQGNFVESHQISTILHSKELETSIKSKTHILLVKNLVKLKEFDTADLELGDPNRLRQTKLYPEALILRAEIDFIKGRPDDSIKSLLRHYYLPQTSEQQKILDLIRVCEILVEFKRISEAQKYWTRIDQKNIVKDPIANERYQLLARSLHRLES